MAIRSPSIPDNIVVHLGAPKEAARNITVPFTEYIKNVASSELYANWPDQALRANILAIISFALNRVYNEWYRSQGYNFDITSSSTYDQAFKENQVFYEKISVIVDEIFNSYIVRGNQVQPLFATYCDGKKTICSGLSQWGSVDLAKAGRSATDILKSYYGTNIKVINNAPIGGDIITFPGTNLSIGSAGDPIRLLKKQLNRIGANYPAIPIILDDSIFFTKDMEEAVKKFQSIFDLNETGIVDKSTWYKIKYIYNAVKNVSDLYSEGIKEEDVEVLYQGKVKLGDTASYIGNLNYYLNTISYFDSDIPYLHLEGYTFTENTEEVVKAFQQKYNIPVTGIIDDRTWFSIIDAYNQTINMIPDNCVKYIEEFFPKRFLLLGEEGEDVLRLQNFLYKICIRTKEIPGVVVSGKFDELTEQSVRYIQRKYNIEENGVVSPDTWDYIVKLSKGTI